MTQLFDSAAFQSLRNCTHSFFRVLVHLRGFSTERFFIVLKSCPIGIVLITQLMKSLRNRIGSTAKNTNCFPGKTKRENGKSDGKLGRT